MKPITKLDLIQNILEGKPVMYRIHLRVDKDFNIVDNFSETPEGAIVTECEFNTKEDNEK